VDRFNVAVRSLTNLAGNAVATLVVARWENELKGAGFQSSQSEA